MTRTPTATEKPLTWLKVPQGHFVRRNAKNQRVGLSGRSAVAESLHKSSFSHMD
jgi:hypothetical protein